MRNPFLSLVILISFFSTYKAQTTIYAAAPVGTGTTNSYMPTGFYTSAYYRNCYLFKGSELPAFTSSLITSLGFSLSAGAIMPVNGTVQIYMQNSGDATYQKGTSYSGIISPMTQVYNGNMLIPSNTNTASTMITLTTPFNYTGGNIYVALSWTAATTFTNTNGSASYYRDISTSGQMGAYQVTNGPNVNTLQQTTVRPVYIFGGINTSADEAAVTGITAPGIIAEAMNVSHQVTARIRNNSNATLTNKQVFLNVTGTNPFTDTQIIPSIAAGATTTVVFAPYTPTAQGLSTMVVSLPADDINTNNQMSWTQSVTCNAMGYFPVTSTFGPQLGYNNSGLIYSCRFNFPTTTTLTYVEFAFPYGPVGAYLYGTLQDASGLIIATTNTAQPIAGSEIYTFTPRVLNANTDYYIGLAQPGPLLTPMTVFNIDNTFVPGRFFISPPNGGTLSTVNNYYFAIVAGFAGPAISTSPVSTVICAGEPITLAANGGVTYTWSSSAHNPVSNPNSAQITVTPESSETYTLAANDHAGCVSMVLAQVDVDVCVGIKNTGAHGQAVILYPNPAQDGQAFVNGLTGPSTITVFNILGEVVLDKLSDEEKVLIDLKGQPSGHYMVRVSGQGASVYTFKLINP